MRGALPAHFWLEHIITSIRSEGYEGFIGIVNVSSITGLDY